MWEKFDYSPALSANSLCTGQSAIFGSGCLSMCAAKLLQRHPLIRANSPTAGPSRSYNASSQPCSSQDNLTASTGLLQMLKTIRIDADLSDGGKMTRSQVGQHAASARWHGS